MTSRHQVVEPSLFAGDAGPELLERRCGRRVLLAEPGGLALRVGLLGLCVLPCGSGQEPAPKGCAPASMLGASAVEESNEGKLDESVYAAQELTGETLYRLTVEEKLPYDQAWELVREEWAFLPSEEDL